MRYAILAKKPFFNGESVHCDAGTKSEDSAENQVHYTKQYNHVIAILYRDLRLSHFCLCKNKRKETEMDKGCEVE